MHVRNAAPNYRAGEDAQAVPPWCEQTDFGLKAREWGHVLLREISNFITKGSTPTTYGFNWEAFGILFLRSECVSPHGLDLDQSMFISPAAHEMLRRSEVRDGDLLITITGNVGRVVLLQGVGVANINQHIARVRISARNVDPSFVFHVLSQFSFRRTFESITTGQAYPQISLQQVREAQVPLPPLPEQRAIAESLSDVDGLLGALDALIAKKRAVKQAAMQQLLTGKTRLPGFNGEWITKRLGELFRFKNGLNKAKRFFGQGTPIVNYMDVFERPVLRTSELAGRVQLSRQEIDNFDVRNGDVFFTRTSETVGEIGTAAAMLDDPTDTVFSGFVLRARPLDRTICDPYKAYCFAADDVRRQIISTASYTTRALTNGRLLARVLVALPTTDEQAAIATVLSDMDAEIAALEARRDKTRAIKQGMMQQLLTGRVRLVEPEAAA